MCVLSAMNEQKSYILRDVSALKRANWVGKCGKRPYCAFKCSLVKREGGRESEGGARER